MAAIPTIPHGELYSRDAMEQHGGRLFSNAGCLLDVNPELYEAARIDALRTDFRKLFILPSLL
jgi:hypothetical protein